MSAVLQIVQMSAIGGALIVLGLHHRVLARRVTELGEAVRGVAEERDALTEELDRVGTTDPVTGLGNRSRLEIEMPILLERADARLTSVGVALIGVDGLMAYEDAHGLIASERLLKETVSGWLGLMRQDDVLLRLDDCTFVALLPGCSTVNAMRVAERLSEVGTQHCRCSVGIAAWDGSETGEQLLARADRGLRESRAAGAPVLV